MCHPGLTSDQVICLPQAEFPQQVLTPIERPGPGPVPARGGHNWSEIFRAKPRLLPDLRERGWTDLFTVVKTKSEVGPAWILHLSMGPDLFLERPTDAQQGRVDSSGLSRAPCAHAANRTLSGSGISSPLSIMSANT